MKVLKHNEGIFCTKNIIVPVMKIQKNIWTLKQNGACPLELYLTEWQDFETE